MNWSKTLGYGVLIWLVVFVLIWLLSLGNLYSGQIIKGIVALVAGVLAYWFASKMGMAGWGKAIGLAVVWVIIAWILDYIITGMFVAGMASSKAAWLGYALIAIGAIAGSMWGKKASSAMPM